VKPPLVNIKKLPNVVLHACKHITENMKLLKLWSPQIRLCLFMFRPMAWKQLNSLTTIITLSWLSGAEVTYPLWVRDVPVFNSRFRQGLLCLIVCFVVVAFYCFVQKHYLSQNFAFSFVFIYLVYLTNCKICDRL